MSGTGWVVAGLVIQCIGLVLQVTGIGQTWSQYGSGERYFEPVHRWSRRAWAWFRRVVLRRRRDAVIHVGAASGSVSFAGGGVVLATGLVLPDPAANPAGFREAIAQEFSRLTQEIASLSHEVTARSREHAAAQEKIVAELEGVAERSRKETHAVAVDGLRLQGLGAFLVASGIVCQVGSLLASG